MAGAIRVHKARTNTISVGLGIDVSADTITSEIRSRPSIDAPLIMTWTVTELTDGTDGELILEVDSLVTAQIKETVGYMDLKRVSGGEVLAVFDEPLEVEFIGSVTA